MREIEGEFGKIKIGEPKVDGKKKRCSYIKDDGQRCDSYCGRRDEIFCIEHLKKMDRYLRCKFLRCENCLVAKSCDFKNYNGIEFCYFEIWSEQGNWKEKEDVNNGLQKILDSEMKWFERLDRVMSFNNKDLEAEYMEKVEEQKLKIAEQLERHLRNYAELQGWKSAKKSEKEVRHKMYLMQKLMFEKPIETEKEGEEPIEVRIEEEEEDEGI